MDPAKAVVFGPIVIFFGVFLLLIIGFLAFVVKLLLKAKASAWVGEVVEKKHKVIDDFDEGEQHRFIVVFKTTEGKTLNVEVSHDIWEDYKVGDKAEKKAGTLWPEKLSE
ncbi:hypothetical protein GYA49_00360 [Candidatus Beckwithbacteria bacterium]|nr:hypothetical protein [Candidatus Beckwithbacteria bacterium]